jgi:hypothetical protein
MSQSNNGITGFDNSINIDEINKYMDEAHDKIQNNNYNNDNDNDESSDSDDENENLVDKLVIDFIAINPEDIKKKHELFGKLIDAITVVINGETAHEIIKTLLDVLVKENFEYLERFVDDLIEMGHEQELVDCVYTSINCDIFKKVNTIKSINSDLIDKYFMKNYHNISKEVLNYLVNNNLIIKEHIFDSYLEACETGKTYYVELLFDIIKIELEVAYLGLSLSLKSNNVNMIYQLLKFINKMENNNDKICNIVTENILQNIINKNKIVLESLVKFTFDFNLLINLDKIFGKSINKENYIKIIKRLCEDSELVCSNETKEIKLENDYNNLIDKSNNNLLNIIKKYMTEKDIDSIKFFSNKLEENIKDVSKLDELYNDLIFDCYLLEFEICVDFFMKKLKSL